MARGLHPAPGGSRDTGESGAKKPPSRADAGARHVGAREGGQWSEGEASAYICRDESDVLVGAS